MTPFIYPIYFDPIYFMTPFILIIPSAAVENCNRIKQHFSRDFFVVIMICDITILHINKAKPAVRLLIRGGHAEET